MRKTLTVLIVTLCMVLTACIKHVPVPGAVNQFDSDTYVSLLTSKAVIDTTKAELAANAFPANVAGPVKTAVNGAVTAYNVADTAYQAYHSTALAGTSTPAQQADVSAKVSNLNTAVGQVTAAKAGTK
jgi:hypothetical protein